MINRYTLRPPKCSDPLLRWHGYVIPAEEEEGRSMTVIADVYRGSGRLTGAVCSNGHTYIAATPGRMDACWANDEAGCMHLAINAVEFASEDEAMDAFLAGEHDYCGHRETVAGCKWCEEGR